MTEVAIKRTELPAPTIDDPNRKVIQIQYRQGELPPRFLYISKAEYTPEKEKAEIKKDIKRREEAKTETLEI